MTTAEVGANTVAERCRAEGGLVQATLGELREELGYRKLGRWVLNEIAENLRDTGLGYFPLNALDGEQVINPRKEDTVWVYDRDGGPRAQVIDAIVNPGKNVKAVLSSHVEGAKVAMTAEQKLEAITRIVQA
ncbi:hypothetical protein [Kribbella deserti]|uniref:Uncharacterized protein n=1 Tax=Kribbella deserti TaxID=1926257 RepID=A0ABV6QVY5_9ACTN